MTWQMSILLTVLVIAFWALFWAAGDFLSKTWQRRMSATLWRSLPYNPGPLQRERDRLKAAAMATRLTELEDALAHSASEVKAEHGE